MTTGLVAREMLCCPECHGDLAWRPDAAECSGCGAVFEQRDPRVVDLLPLSFAHEAGSAWSERQHLMVSAYDALAADPAHARAAYANDFPPLARFLRHCRGRVLDLGGGNGISRHWLPEGAECVVVDPDPSWLDQGWEAIAPEFPCLAQPLPFVRGAGERLPFRPAAFDHVLAIWSLNHASRPEDVVAECARVLRAGGRLHLVVDDVAPSWADVLGGAYPAAGASHRARVLGQKLAALVRGWPVHEDHLPMTESDLRRWSRGHFDLVDRWWSGPYLVLTFAR